ncbi:MAG: DNA repair protein RecN [Kineosporiaceae bacterium]
MLLEMRLRGLGVIRDAVLEFGPGLTVVTGETGAGKTMVVTGLGLLMGGRAAAGTVRSGEPAALVEGRLRVGGPTADRATEVGAELDDGDVLIVSRTVSAEGRSRAHLGGRSAPVGLLAELAEDLLTVHGQSDQLTLRSTVRQRQLLDRFAGAPVAGPLREFRTGWARLRQVEAELDEITGRARERAQEAELLRLGVAEIERLDPQPGEDAALREEAVRLAHAEELRNAATAAHLALTGDPDATAGPVADVAGLLDRAWRSLDAVREHDPALAGLADRLREVSYLAADVGTECAAYADGVEADPARLAAVEERRAELTGLTRAYGGSVDAVLDWARRSSDRLLALDHDDDRLGELEAERDRLRHRLGMLAAELSGARTAAGTELGTRVSAELRQLAMPDARLQVRLTRRADPAGLVVDLGDGPHPLAAGPDGVDDVEILLIPHAGAGPRPLGRGASGGELSRVMLGLQVVLGVADPVPTFVFDEVDAGVGGAAALEIGKRLARLARGSQVLVVTHLPQVAAFADRHLQVVKSSDGQVTESGVTRLEGEDRLRELARMLGGFADSGSARAHAEELLAAAAAYRARSGTGDDRDAAPVGGGPLG